MKEITKLMIHNFKLMKIGCDFAGYKIYRKESLSFHHLIVPHKDCKEQRIPFSGYVEWNGAILVQKTSHDYIHIIERIDREVFDYITMEMVEQNVKGHLDIENLKRIKEALLYFEDKYKKVKTKENKPIIKRTYITDRML